LGACQSEKQELELARSLCDSGSITKITVRLLSTRVEQKKKRDERKFVSYMLDKLTRNVAYVPTAPQAKWTCTYPLNSVAISHEKGSGAGPIMTMAPASMQIVIDRLLRSLCITKGPPLVETASPTDRCSF
jgi:hypothetical protein